MASAKGTQTVLRQVKPLLSLDKEEARTRVLSLYRAWHRNIPYMLKIHDLPLTKEKAQEKLREKFRANSHVKDIRIIDMLVIQGQQDLKEVAEQWAQVNHIMSKFFKESHIDKKPDDFLSKFLSGHE